MVVRKLHQSVMIPCKISPFLSIKESKCWWALTSEQSSSSLYYHYTLTSKISSISTISVCAVVSLENCQNIIRTLEPWYICLLKEESGKASDIWKQKEIPNIAVVFPSCKSNTLCGLPVSSLNKCFLLHIPGNTTPEHLFFSSSLLCSWPYKSYFWRKYKK